MALGQYLGAGSSVTKGLYHLTTNSNDSSGNANNGTDTSMSYTNGMAVFNGTSSGIALPSGTGLSLIGNQTYFFTMILSGLPSSGLQYRLFNNYGASSPYGLYISILNTAGTYSIRFDYGSGVVCTANFAFSTGVQYDVKVEHNDTSDTDSIWINGVNLVTNTSRTSNPASTTAIRRIGNEDGTGKYYNGRIKEFIIDTVSWGDPRGSRFYTYSKGLYATL